METSHFWSDATNLCLSSHQALPLLRSEQPDALGFDADLQHLYATIVAHGDARGHKRKLSEEDEAPAEEPAVASSQGSFGLKSIKQEKNGGMLVFFAC